MQRQTFDMQSYTLFTWLKEYDSFVFKEEENYYIS